MTTEVIYWTPASTKPDVEIRVLCWRAEEVDWFFGWWDDEAGAWFDCATGGIVEGVTHWAHVVGPQAQPVQEPVAWEVSADFIKWRGVPNHTTQPQPPAEPVQELDNGGKTGWPPGLLQDDCRGLSKWLASRPDARQRLREALAEPVQEPVQEQCKGDPGECEFNGGCMYACAKPEPLCAAPPQPPAEPVSVTDLQQALIETNLIDPDAIDDPEGYDAGFTVAHIDALHGLLFKSQRQAETDTDCHAQGICQRTGYSVGQKAEPVQEPVAGRLLTDDEIQTEWSQTPQNDYAEGLWFGRRIENLVRSIALAEPQEPDPWGAGYEAGYAAGMAERPAEPVQKPKATRLERGVGRPVNEGTKGTSDGRSPQGADIPRRPQATPLHLLLWSYLCGRAIRAANRVLRRRSLSQ